MTKQVTAYSDGKMKKVSRNEAIWSLACQHGEAPGMLKKVGEFWPQTQGYKNKTLRNVVKEESRRRTRP